MSQKQSDKAFRNAAEAEGGMPVSAGARIAHVHSILESGKGLFVDLSAVPAERRNALVDQINELVNLAQSSMR